MLGTNHLDKRFQVFISSTFLDLKKERALLNQSLVKCNYIVEGMERFPAANKKQWEIIKERINISDIYILIIGDRYGSIAQNALQFEPDIVKADEMLSFTHLEFRYAKHAGLPILAFIKTKRKPDALVDEFIKEVQGNDLTTAKWANSVELVSDVLAGIQETINTGNFAATNGWVKTSSLNSPINLGHKEVFLESKLHYIKFVSYSNKQIISSPLYSKYISRLNKELPVWDEYTTLTIHHLSHYVENFQYYIRTDGDAVDFFSILPFLDKLSFADKKAGAKDNIFNPNVTVPSNVYVNACSYYNGFQDGNMDLGVKAQIDTKKLRLFIDFTSIPNFKTLFRLCNCWMIMPGSTEIKMDITSESKTLQDGVYYIEKENVAKDVKIMFDFELTQ